MQPYALPVNSVFYVYIVFRFTIPLSLDAWVHMHVNLFSGTCYIEQNANYTCIVLLHVNAYILIFLQLEICNNTFFDWVLQYSNALYNLTVYLIKI